MSTQASDKQASSRPDGSRKAARPARRRISASDRQLYLALNREAARYWHRCLVRIPRGMAFLEGRGFPNVVHVRDQYMLGYAPTAGDDVRPFVSYILKKGFEGVSRADLRAALLAIGLAKKPDKDGDRVVDFFYGRLMVPIPGVRCSYKLQEDGAEIVGFGGRDVPRDDDEERAKAAIAEGREVHKRPKWLNTPEGPIFHKGSLLYGLPWANNAAVTSRKVVLLEGYFDTLQVREGGCPFAMATLGTALTPEHINRLPPVSKKRALRVIIATDDDAAGRKSAKRSAKLLFLLRPDVEVRIARPPDGLDPDDLVRLRGPVALQQLLDGAMTPLERELADRADAPATLFALTELMDEAVSLLSPSVADRARDIAALSAWAASHFSVPFAAHALEEALAQTAAAREAATTPSPKTADENPEGGTP